MKKTILLIDDDNNQFMIFNDALHQLRAEVKCFWAETTVQALKMLDLFTPNFILLNLHMPTCNGLATLAKMKEKNHLHGVPVFLYSSGIDANLWSTAIAMGATNCMRKPETLNVAMQVLRKILDTEKKLLVTAPQNL